MTTTTHRSSTILRRSAGVTALALGLGLTLSAGADPATAAPAANPVTTAVAAANAALSATVTDVRAGRYGPAKTDLSTVQSQTIAANTAAGNLVGKPPTDPESDDLPGPPAVTSALRLDQRVTTRLVPLYDGLRRPGVVKSIRTAVGAAQIRRDALLTPVLALPPEGDLDDYADGLADSLPIYTAEVKALQTALNTYTLTGPARLGLTNALDRARATRARMVAVFGGGERPSGH